jgi:hypothetical protein
MQLGFPPPLLGFCHQHQGFSKDCQASLWLLRLAMCLGQ